LCQLLRHAERRIRADACRCARPVPELILLLIDLLDDLDQGVATSAACDAVLGPSDGEVMVMDTFSAARFRDETAAREYLESLRWPGGPICPHCGVVNHAYPIKPAGTYRCAEAVCRKNFTVTMNSPMERSHIALHKWVQAFHLMCSSKKGVSAHQLHRTLDITYRSAWFMAHRIRECMRSGGLAPLGGTGKTVEVDETFIGRLEGQPKRRAGHGHR
jgi:transposase-like protein